MRSGEFAGGLSGQILQILDSLVIHTHGKDGKELYNGPSLIYTMSGGLVIRDIYDDE